MTIVHLLRVQYFCSRLRQFIFTFLFFPSLFFASLASFSDLQLRCNGIYSFFAFITQLHGVHVRMLYHFARLPSAKRLNFMALLQILFKLCEIQYRVFLIPTFFLDFRRINIYTFLFFALKTTDDSKVSQIWSISYCFNIEM